MSLRGPSYKAVYQQRLILMHHVKDWASWTLVREFRLFLLIQSSRVNTFRSSDVNFWYFGE